MGDRGGSALASLNRRRSQELVKQYAEGNLPASVAPTVLGAALTQVIADKSSPRVPKFGTSKIVTTHGVADSATSYPTYALLAAKIKADLGL
jgi:hypothetical protein